VDCETRRRSYVSAPFALLFSSDPIVATRREMKRSAREARNALYARPLVNSRARERASERLNRSISQITRISPRASVRPTESIPGARRYERLKSSRCIDAVQSPILYLRENTREERRQLCSTSHFRSLQRAILVWDLPIIDVSSESSESPDCTLRKFLIAGSRGSRGAGLPREVELVLRK